MLWVRWYFFIVRLPYDYKWPHSGYRSLQPQVIDGNKLLIGTGMGTGTRLVQFTETDGAFATEEIWTSLNMKPDFNDFLVHQGHLYGFDNLIFACVDLSNGKRKWKGGRYDKGQALLLADSDLIVVVTEKGELVLLRTNPEKLEEIFKIQALEGKTWNHPIVVGDKLYLPNAREAVCYQLPIQAAVSVQCSVFSSQYSVVGNTQSARLAVYRFFQFFKPI